MWRGGGDGGSGGGGQRVGGVFVGQTQPQQPWSEW